DARQIIRERKDAIDKDTVDAYTKRMEREYTVRLNYFKRKIFGKIRREGKLLLRRHETNQLLPPQDMSSYQLDYLDRL
ncbi:hypothetical protein P154DRAFT_519104, partial [Amniculicola lignicola CBS 123094]